MRTALDRFGRVVAPKSVRRSLGLEAGAELRMKDGILVFAGEVGDDCETLRRLRADRLRKAGGVWFS